MSLLNLIELLFVNHIRLHLYRNVFLTNLQSDHATFAQYDSLFPSDYV